MFNPVIKKIIVTFSYTCLLIICISTLTACEGHLIGMLNPKGVITYEERKLFFDTLALMLIVVLPVIVMSITFVFHYQVSHQVKDYKPNWGHDYFLESLWWGIPCAIILVLAVLTWKKTYELDPYRRIPGHSQKPLLIQVIGLPWKWLFIYPEYNVASLNYLVIPVGRQVEYWMTVDNVPMSSFFIPQIGSQIYAMAGMRTRLHLVANHVGVFDGMNTQYNGNGFSDMHFPVFVVDPMGMQSWIEGIKKISLPLNAQNYQLLLKPSFGVKPQFYNGVEQNLFENVIHLYMSTNGRVHPRANVLPLKHKNQF